MTDLPLLGLIALPLILLTGTLLMRRLPCDDEPMAERLFLALALGFFLVSYTAMCAVGVVGVMAPVFVRWWTLILAALSIMAVLAWRLHRDGEPVLRWDWPKPTRWDWVLIALGVLVLLLAMLQYDRIAFDEERCIIRSSMLPYHNYLSRELSGGELMPSYVFDRNAFLLWNNGQREGMLFVLVPWLAQVEYLGFRVCFAFSHLVLFGSTFIAARRLLGLRWLAVGIALLGCFNPFTLRMADVDDNLLAVAVGALALALLLRRPVRWFWLMLPYGLFLGIRHEALLTLPGLLAFLWLSTHSRRARRTALIPMAIGLPLFTFPFLVYHGFLFVNLGVPYEPFLAHEQTFQHSLMGLVDFEIRGLMNWPFVEAPLRSPYSAFPTLLLFPMILLQELGLLTWALAGAGLVWLWRHRRPWAWLCLGWFLPFMGLLLIQSNWTEHDKMGIPNTVLTPVLLCAGAGVLWLIQQRRGWPGRSAILLGVVGALALSIQGFGKLDFAMDERVMRFRPFYIGDDFPLVSIDEDPQLVERAQQRATSLHLLPFQGLLQPGARSHALQQLRRRLITLSQDLRHPSFAIDHPALPAISRRVLGMDGPMHFPVSSMVLHPMPAEPHEESERMVVELDLREPPYRDGLILTPARGPGPEPVRLEAGRSLRVVDLELDWTNGLGSLVVTRDPVGDPILTLVFHRDSWAELEDRPDIATHLAPPGGIVRLDLPASSELRFGLFSSFYPKKTYSWVQRSRADGTLTDAWAISP